MDQLRRSPNRGQFNIDCELKRVEEGEKTAEEAEEMIDFYKTWRQREIERENSDEFKQDNMEYDLRTSDYIVEKCKVDHYAQNLYAALCNNDFIKNQTWNILSDKTWGCSWRYAGGIIAHLQEKGDYIDWYCSGIHNELSDEEYNQLTKEQQENYLYVKTKYVGEGYVTDEIREDLFKIGWIVKGEK